MKETLFTDTITPVQYKVTVTKFHANDSLVRVALSCEGDFTDMSYILVGRDNKEEIKEAIDVLTEALEQRRAMHILNKGAW